LPSPEFIQFAAVAVVALAVGSAVYMFALPYFSGERKAEKRKSTIALGPARTRIKNAAQPLQMRKKQVQDTIKELEAKQQAQRRVTLRTKLIRAGLSITPRTYYLLSAALGLFGALIVLLTGSGPIVALLAAFVCAFGLPRLILSRLIKRRQEKFLFEFANAVDIIVRGVKSGLPLSDCLRVIVTEMPEPIKSEFIDLVEQQKVGVPISRAFERMYERMPLQEVSFFAIVVSIQAQTGGNLAETLSNLSQVLRDRYRLHAKVKTFSAEAKVSAMIIGSLPPLVMLLVFLTAPDYMALLWTEELGNILLIGSGVWMAIGIFVMRKMIHFDY